MSSLIIAPLCSSIRTEFVKKPFCAMRSSKQSRGVPMVMHFCLLRNFVSVNWLVTMYLLCDGFMTMFVGPNRKCR